LANCQRLCLCQRPCLPCGAVRDELSAPQPGDERLCAVCHGPSGRGSARCYQCDLHQQCAPDSLADLVVPVAFAIKGSSHARMLWQYKSPRTDARVRAEAALTLRALLLGFLRDHGRCLWQAAGIAEPTHLAVVPTARGRPGPHPLRTLVDEHLAGPWAGLLPGAVASRAAASRSGIWIRPGSGPRRYRGPGSCCSMTRGRPARAPSRPPWRYAEQELARSSRWCSGGTLPGRRRMSLASDRPPCRSARTAAPCTRTQPSAADHRLAW
jgi:hypothetical protein